ncbi:uncharacterized protein LOC111635317 [Centruroides sculpturatus]|uniref:uncharacterized protein LOC111634989 n=1 Tax=Centruroides sculpturatus TaxID=218467 RepID=UPI000C6E843F|nr:uncharacterized protein LOC111634989 [Centruroides sculpturatus]XP_023236019.1 uncharacterized protein LOC111635317 [Centruroides sculpturatus]XP_023236025.1 uncharacterized protein LOC111635317 [Centruroides sculpturatus]XP_023236033.1 uncharacterized protein LOC111635317 [Centruroides sculpturatus]
MKMQLVTRLFNFARSSLCMRRLYTTHIIYSCLQTQLKVPCKYSNLTFKIVMKQHYATYLENQELNTVLLSHGLTEEELDDMWKTKSQLLNYPVTHWNNTIEILNKHGFSINDIKNILMTVPSILEIKPNDLNNTINKWREQKLGEKKLLMIINNTPWLLLLKDKYIDERVKDIYKMFTNLDRHKLLEICPLIFIEDWNSILEKIQYIQEAMGFTQMQIVKGKCLEHTLLHIKTRHMCAVMCGKFKRLSPKKNILTNISLKKIADTTNRDFAKICGISLEEYYVFCDIMKELDLDENSDDDV